MNFNWRKFVGGLGAAAIVAMAGTTASAVGPINLIENGDIETITRFTPHELDHPNGYPDAWHHSQNSAWSGPIGGPMFVSPTHSLYLPDNNTSGDGDEEMRSFATSLGGGNPGTLDLSWQWKWDISSAPGTVFSATVRVSENPVGGFDLNTGGTLETYTFNTPGPNSGGVFLPFSVSVPLAPDDQSFDIIFVTGDNLAIGPGQTELETGVMWVDDVCASVPEPATMALFGLGSLGLMMVSRRRRG